MPKKIPDSHGGGRGGGSDTLHSDFFESQCHKIELPGDLRGCGGSLAGRRGLANPIGIRKVQGISERSQD